MKRIFTFLFASILFISKASAQDEARGRGNYRNTKFTLTVLNNGSFRVVIDGRSYNLNVNDDELSLTNLQPGNHSIAVYSGNRGRSSRERSVYQGQFYLRDQYHFDMVINRFGKAFTDEQYLGYNGNTNYPGTQYNYREMSAADFAQLKQTLTSESFDATRLQIATQAANANYFSVAQVKQIMQLFSYEENKLSIAKSLYTRTVDKQNYYSVAEVFSFSTTKEQLMDFLRTQQP